MMYRKRSRKLSKGFTLIELLVAMVLAFIVIVPLMGFMINMMGTDRREQAKATSEQEIQVALEYITQDVEQAIYIYDADGINNNSIATPPGIKDQIPPIAKNSTNCSDPNSCIPVLVFWKRELAQATIPVADVTTSQKNDSFVYSLVAYYLIKNIDTRQTSSGWIGRFEIKDGVKNPDSPNSYIDETSTDVGRSSGFKLFDLNTGGTLKEKMNRWKNSGEAFTARTDILVKYIDQGNITASCPANTQQVPLTLSGGFYACVDSAKTTAQIYIRGNALARIQSQAEYSPSLAAYFPSANVQVQGRGLLNEE